MRKILRRLEVVTDDWEVLAPANDGGAATSAQPSLIVSLSELRESADQLQASTARLGVALKPADKVEDLAPFLARVSLVTVEFPGPGEGRGYTQARLLRERYRFTGEVRAVGAGVKRDLLFFMARSGVESFDLAPGEDFDSAQQALTKYNVAYQPGAPHSSVQRQRFLS